MLIVRQFFAKAKSGSSVHHLSQRFVKIMQERQSLSINRTSTSISKFLQLEVAVLPLKISVLSSGGFVGMVADDLSNKITFKTFHCEIQNDHAALKREEESYQPIPVVRTVDQAMI